MSPSPYTESEGFSRLNPCCIGTCSMRTPANYAVTTIDGVLILVVLEHAQ